MQHYFLMARLICFLGELEKLFSQLVDGIPLQVHVPTFFTFNAYEIHVTIAHAKSEVAKEMQLQENTLFDLEVKVKQKVAHFPSQHVICVPKKFEFATLNG